MILAVPCFPSLEFETCWVVFWMCIWKLVGSVNNSSYAILQFCFSKAWIHFSSDVRTLSLHFIKSQARKLFSNFVKGWKHCTLLSTNQCWHKLLVMGTNSKLFKSRSAGRPRHQGDRCKVTNPNYLAIS